MSIKKDDIKPESKKIIANVYKMVTQGSMLTDFLVKDWAKKTETPSEECTFTYKKNKSSLTLALRRIGILDSKKKTIIIGSIWKESPKKVETLDPHLSEKSQSAWSNFKKSQQTVGNFAELHFIADFENKVALLASNSKENINPRFFEFILEKIPIEAELAIYPDEVSFDKFKKKKLNVQNIEIGATQVKNGLYFTEEKHLVKCKKYVVKLHEIEDINEPISLLNKLEEYGEEIDVLKVWETENKVVDLLGGNISFEEELPLDDDDNFNFDYVKTFLETSHERFIREYSGYVG